MADLQRSAHMSYLQVLVGQDVAEDFADAMARSGSLMFTNLNEHLDFMSGLYMREIIRLQEVETQVRDIASFLNQYDVTFDDDVKEDDLANTPRATVGQDAGRRLDTLEAEVEQTYRNLNRQIQAERKLAKQFEMEVDKMATLNFKDDLLRWSEELSFETDENGERINFRYICGIVPADRKITFDRQVFLASRGNAITAYKELPEDPEKFAFVIHYLGSRIGNTLGRLTKFMNVNIWLTSEDTTPIDEMKQTTERQIRELERVLGHSLSDLRKNLTAATGKIKNWKVAAMQEKAIRVTLNKFEIVQGGMLRAEGWAPTQFIDRINHALEVAKRGKGKSPTVVEKIDAGNRTPPTFFQLNKFTTVFQGVIDTYGTPRYREYNPTVPSIITFPFLFAMMYGDMFHGTCVFLCALFIVVREDSFKGKKLNELMVYLYGGRYLLLLMGMFSMYNGCIYNDCMSLSLTLWSDSKWHESGEEGVDSTWNGVYPFGLDPVWHGRNNMIGFTNSMKMKMSVLFGVTQMTFGLSLKALNHIQENDYLTLFFEFIPQLVFMCTFFVYMCFTIVMKWTINWELKDFAPPSLITLLVNMVLAPGTVNDETQLFEDLEFQGNLQKFFVLAMMLSVPTMLLVKPAVLWCRHGGSRADYDDIDHAGDDEEGGEAELVKKHSAGGGHGHGHGEKFEFGEVVIHQMIHTIEYVLGTVSNTASYLRLWALSLAHAQLSEVFYQKTLLEMMLWNGPTLFIGVSAFFAVTFGVLIVMDQLECFLHALRLHWVEFQNKFFYADGNPFEPFDYKELLAVNM